MDSNFLILESALFIIATLYSMTGHGGASGYIAVMVLLGMAPEEIKPLALSLNLVVSAVASYQFFRAGHFRRELFLPFIIASVPFAMLGGYLHLSNYWFHLILGLSLIFAALRIAIRQSPDLVTTTPRSGIARLAGAFIGLLSGLIGIGGGIFLTPLLILMGWANPKQAAAVSAPFILFNSLAGLAGYLTQADHALPSAFPGLAVSVLIGGLIGSHLGSRTLPMPAIARILGLVLLIGGVKLLYI